MIVIHKLLDCNKMVVTLKLLVERVGVQELRSYFFRKLSFLRGRFSSTEKCVSLKDAHFYGEGDSLRKRRNSEDEINFKTIGLIFVETALFYIVKLWHSATVIKLLFRFSNLPPFSIFVSQQPLKRVTKNNSSSVINTLVNRGFFSRAARSIFDHRPTRPRPKTRAVQSRVIKLRSVHSIHP